MIKQFEQMLLDDAEMRVFYEQCGISKRTTEAAIKVRRNRPPVQQEGSERPRQRRPLGKFKDR